MNAELAVIGSLSRGKHIEATNYWFSREFRVSVFAMLLHVPLGLVLYNAGPLAIAHPLIVFGFGLFLAINRRVSLANVALLAGYIVGSEVLWRMAHIPVYWESGKYMSAAILALALIRRRRYQIPSTPTVYFLLLVPGCLITIANTSLSQAYSNLSFHMSGPFLLAVSCWFFFHCRMRPFQLRRLLIVMMLPLMSVAVSTLFYTVTNEDIHFTGESNFATSGGFGPNQVSAMLGLGFFLALAGLTLFEKRSGFGPYFALLALLFAAMSVMTFSRGGIYNATGGILVLTIFQFRNISAGLKRTVPVLILASVFLLVIFPYLDSATDGALGERFEDTGTASRWDIVRADIEIFLEDPFFGVGLGASDAERRHILGRGATSHTEFSRLASEHGIFGLAALIALAVFVARNLRRPNSTLGKIFIAGAAAWSVLFMMNAGMRLAAPSFMLGISFLAVAQMRKASANFRPRK